MANYVSSGTLNTAQWLSPFGGEPVVSTALENAGQCDVMRRAHMNS